MVVRCWTGDIGNNGMPGSFVDGTKDENENELEHILQDAVMKGIIEELAKCNLRGTILLQSVRELVHTLV